MTPIPEDEEVCLLCENPDQCGVCHELETWHDMFGMHWCGKSYWGQGHTEEELEQWKIQNERRPED